MDEKEAYEFLIRFRDAGQSALDSGHYTIDELIEEVENLNE